MGYADYETSFSVTGNSDQDRLQKIGFFYENEKLDISYPYARDLPFRGAVGIGMDDGFSRGKSFQGRSVFLQGGRKLSDSYSIEGGLTYATLNSDLQNDLRNERFFPDLTFKAVIDSLYLRLTARSYFLYQDLMFPGAIDANMTGEEVSGFLSYRFFEKLRLVGLLRHISLSDSNHRDIQELSLLYGLMPTSPWVWFGFGVSSYSHRESTTAYWSPQPYLSYGSRLEASVPLTERLQLGTGLNLSRYSENNTSQGAEYFGSLALQYGGRDSSFFRLYYERGGTFQVESPSFSDNVTLTAHFLFE